MARGLFRKVSFMKTVGFYRSLWKRTLLRLFFPGYGMRGAGWLNNPKKAFYNWIYHRTSISLPKLLGYKPSLGGTMAALFVASLFNLVTLPVDTAKAASRASKIKKGAKKLGGSFGKIKDFDTTHKSNTGKTTSSHKSESTASTVKTSSKATSEQLYAAAKSKPQITTSFTTPKPISDVSEKAPSVVRQKKQASAKKTSTANVYIPDISHISEKNTPIPLSEACKSLQESKSPDPVEEPDENIPKSTPKNMGDSYIRKRMIIAGSSYCQKEVLDKLQIGSYFDVSAEPNNLYDKNAVVLTYEGEKIGYVSKSDNLPIASCLRLGRTIYGVITKIKTDSQPTEYEFELWFKSKHS